MTATLSTYMARAGIKSNRELASLTGIKHSTVDNIVRHPARARGYQIREIVRACGMSDREVVEIFTERG